MKPVLLAQLSDLHLGAAWQGVDPEPRLVRAIEGRFWKRRPPGFALHVLLDGELSSQVELLGS